MAEYYPLLSRAVATLRDAPVEKRRAIYERARGALLGQLRSMQPAVPEEAILRESTALDEAIERIEAEMTAPLQPEPAPAIAPPPPPPEPPDPPLAPPVVAVEPSVPPASAMRPPTARAPSASPRATGARPAAEELQRIIADPGETPPVIRAAREEDEAKGAAGRAAAALPSAPRLQVPNFADAVVEAGEQAGRDGKASTPSRDEPARPAAPRPVTRQAFNPRLLIMALIGVAVVLVIAYTAYRLRDRPEALARARAARIAAEEAESKPAGKVNNRAEEAAPAAVAATPVPAANSPTPPAAGPAATAAAALPAPSAQPDAATTTTNTAAPPAAAELPAATGGGAATATAPASEPAAIPVAQRAAFLIDAPDDPQKVKTYVGTVLWRADSINPGQGQPLLQTVHADVDIPEAGLRLTMQVQKNLEAQFPASHTMDLRFTPASSSLVGGVKQINVPQMRKDDSPSGDPLVGLPVTITENYFLVGLSRGDATARNLDLIKSRNWFDIPILMMSGKVAKVTFEKGATGQQVIDQVFASWQ